MTTIALPQQITLNWHHFVNGYLILHFGSFIINYYAVAFAARKLAKQMNAQGLSFVSVSSHLEHWDSSDQTTTKCADAKMKVCPTCSLIVLLCEMFLGFPVRIIMYIWPIVCFVANICLYPIFLDSVVVYNKRQYKNFLNSALVKAKDMLIFKLQRRDQRNGKKL